MAYKAGAAYVSIDPDLRGFHRQVGDFLKDEDAEFSKAGERWGAKAGSAFKDRLRADFADLPHAKIKAQADTARASEQLDRAARNRKAKIEVKLDWLKSPLALGALGGLALGPQALGIGAGALLGAGAWAAAAAGVAAYASVAVPMFAKVTKAQKALATAQAQYAKATTKAGKASALRAEAAATAGLTKSERDLAKELTGLQDAWHGLQKSEEPVVTRSLTPWFRAAHDGLGLLKPVISDTADAIGFLGQSADIMLQDPFWKTFSREVGTTARESVIGFGSAAMHAGDGLAHLFVTFAPDIRKIPPLVDEAARAFDRWASGVKANGLDNFLSRTFSKGNLATLRSDGKALATTFGNLAKATANLSPAAFLGLSKVLTILSKLSPGQIEALGLLYGLGKTVGGAGNLGKLITGTGSLGGSKLGKTGKIIGIGAVAIPIIGTVVGGLKGTSSGPGGKNWWDNPFGMPGPGSKGSANNWLTSWAPYERIITTDIPRAWSTAYGAFQRDFAGKITSWFTSSLPHAFTMGIPSRIWSPAYEGFERDVGSPIAHWFEVSLPHAFGDADSVLKGAGSRLAHGLGAGWNTSSKWVSSQFGRARGWATGTLRSAGSWLTSHGRSAARGLGNAWDDSSGWVRAQFGRARGWATDELRSAGSWLGGAGRLAGRGLGSGWNSASGWVRSQFARAYGWVAGEFRGAGGWLLGAGRAIMSSLLSGLKSGWNDVTSFFHWVTGMIPHLKGPVSYDRQLLIPNGIALMSGLETGMQQGFGRVRALTASMAPRLALSVPGGLPGVTGPAPAGMALKVTYAGPSSGAIAAIVKDLRYEIQHATGGDVQAHLGRGKARS